MNGKDLRGRNPDSVISIKPGTQSQGMHMHHVYSTQFIAAYHFDACMRSPRKTPDSGSNGCVTALLNGSTSAALNPISDSRA